MSNAEKNDCNETPKPDTDPGAWPENPPLGTPAALHNQLTKQHEEGGVQHPTHIEPEHEHREREDGDQK